MPSFHTCQRRAVEEILSRVGGWGDAKTRVTRAPFTFPDSRGIHVLPHESSRMFNASVWERRRPCLPPPQTPVQCFGSCKRIVAKSKTSLSSHVLWTVFPVQHHHSDTEAEKIPRLKRCHWPVGICMCVSTLPRISVHIHDSGTQSPPLRLLHILVMTNTPVLQNALAGPHSSGKQRSVKCESAALCPGSRLQDQSCSFFSLPTYFYILLFLINPLLRLFLKFPEKTSLTFWNSVSGLQAMRHKGSSVSLYLGCSRVEYTREAAPSQICSNHLEARHNPPTSCFLVLGRIHCEFQALAQG